MNPSSSAGPETPATNPPCGPGRWLRFGRGCWRGFRWSVRSFYVVAALIAYALFHLHHIGLPDFLKEPLLGQLANLGLELDYSRLRLRLTQGLVAENVTLRFRGSRPDQYMFVKELDLAFDWWPLLQFSSPAIRGLGLHSGEGIVPVENAPGEPSAVLHFSEISGELAFLTPENWELKQLVARMNNVQFEGMGRLTNVTGFRIQRRKMPSNAPPVDLKNPTLARTILGLDQIQFRESPHIELTFALDGNALERSTLQMRFGTAGARGKYGDFDDVRLSVDIEPATTNEWMRSNVHLDSAAARTRWGSFETLSLHTSTWFRPTNTLPTRLEWELKSKSLLHEKGQLGTLALKGSVQATNRPPATTADAPSWFTAAWPEGPGFATRLELDAADLSTPWVSATNVQWTATSWNATNDWLPHGLQWELHAGETRTTNGHVSTLSARGHVLPVPPEARPKLEPFWAPILPWTFHVWARAEQLTTRTGPSAEQVELDATWHDAILGLNQISLRLPAGNLVGSATLHATSRDLETRWKGDVQLSGLADFFDAPTWARISQSGVGIDNRVRLDLHAQGRLPQTDLARINWSRELSHGVGVDGSLAVTNLDLQGVRLAEVRLPFRVTNSSIQIPELFLRHETGTLQAAVEADWESHVFHTRLQSTLDPLAFRPLIRSPGLSRQLDLVSLSLPPALTAEAWGNWERPKTIGLNATVAITNATYRLEPVTELRTSLNFTNRDLVFTGVEIHQGTNAARASLLRFDLDTQLLHITNGSAHLPLDSVARIIGPKTAKTLAPYHFPQPPNVQINGIIATTEKGSSDVLMQVRAPELEWWYFRFTNLLATVAWVDDRLAITNVASGFYGGLMSADIDVNVGNAQDAVFRCNSTFADVQVPLLMADLTTTTNQLEGILSGQVIIHEGHGKRGVPWHGDGNAQIRDGLLWGLPLFGILSPVFNSIAPGMGSARFNAGNAFFTLTNNSVDFSRVELLSSAMRMDLHGTVTFDGDLDLILEAQPLRGVPVLGAVLDVVLAPFTKLLEYKVHGTLGHPEAELRNVPSFILVPLQPFKTLRYLFGNPEAKPKDSPPP